MQLLKKQWPATHFFIQLFPIRCAKIFVYATSCWYYLVLKSGWLDMYNDSHQENLAGDWNRSAMQLCLSATRTPVPSKFIPSRAVFAAPLFVGGLLHRDRLVDQFSLAPVPLLVINGKQNGGQVINRLLFHYIKI
jgi:hypothetical protein